MKINQIIKWFENNKLDNLERARQYITLGEPCVGCDIVGLVKDNEKRMNNVSVFLYYYGFMEANIKNYKKFSTPSNYDAETLELIEEQIIFNMEQYKQAFQKLFGEED